jgi:ATP-dependent Lon protease
VRSLEREVGKICSSKAVEYSKSREGNEAFRGLVDLGDLERILGVPRFEQDVKEKHHRPGVVTYVIPILLRC